MMAPSRTSALTAAGAASELRYLGYNQDMTRLAVGTKGGSLTYKLDPFELLDEKAGESTSIVERLFTTQLVAHVGGGEDASSSQRCLRVINAGTEMLIRQLNYDSAVLRVRLNRLRMVVVLEDTIYLYDLSNLHLLHTIEEVQNKAGVCALSACSKRPSAATAAAVAPAAADAAHARNYLAYVRDDAPGRVYVHDALNLQAVTIIEAHSSAIGCVALSDDGERLATASVKGTVIRVWNPTNGEKLFELRRGLSTNACIYCMSFSADAALLCVSSDKPTVHIFCTVQGQPEPAAEPADAGGWGLSNVLQSISAGVEGYLPTPVADMWSQSRSFAQITLPNPGFASICTVLPLSGAEEAAHGAHLQVLVASFDGYLYKYKLDLAKGGECELMFSCALRPEEKLTPEDVGGAAPAAAAATAVEPPGGSGDGGGGCEQRAGGAPGAGAGAAPAGEAPLGANAPAASDATPADGGEPG